MYFAAGEMCGANLIYFVHFASQNTIPTLLRREPLSKGALRESACPEGRRKEERTVYHDPTD